MKNIKLLIGLLALLAVTGLEGCHSSDKQEAKKKPRESRAARNTAYQVAAISQQNVSQRVQLPGEFLAFREVSLYPKANGFVEKMYVDRGAKVKKGQVLMVLDAPEVEEQLVAARSRYMKAEAVFIGSKDNYRRLLASSKTPGAVSALDLEMAQARMMSDSAAVMGERANYRALEKTKSYMTVRAPFNGVITDRNIHPGALVGPGSKSTEPMLVLQEQSKLRLVVDVPETYSMKVQEGNTVQYKANALPGRVFEGKISRLSGRMNPRFRSETVEIDVDNSEGLFKPGMFAEIILSAEGTPGAVAVPTSAIVTSTERQYIIKVDGNKTRFVEVKQGNRAEGMIEVFGDVQPNDKVIINASADIKEGAEISS